jgi:hypothetical protein
MAIVGAAFLGAVRLADAAVHVQHDDALRLAGMHPIDPSAGQIGESREVRLARQPRGLKAGHLTGRSGLTIQPVATDHGAHRRIVRETVSIVHVLIPGQAAEHRLTQRAGQQVPGVHATTTFRQRRASKIGQSEGVIKLPVGEQTRVGGDPAAVEFQLQAAVERDPQSATIRFTRWVVHPRASSSPATR